MHHVLQPVVNLNGNTPVFQPIIALETFTVASARMPSIFGYEALARFPDGVPPDRHWQAAQGQKITHPHTRVLERLEIRSWTGAVRLAISRGIRRPVFINIVSLALFDPKCQVALMALKRKAETFGFTLVPELTENNGAGFDQLMAAAKKLRAMGFGAISLDDCVEGFTPLMAVTRIKPEFAKMDVAFLRDSPLAAGGIISEVRKWGGQVVIERTETAEDARFAISLGATHAQGYFFGRPE